jgi:hypothetical protein
MRRLLTALGYRECIVHGWTWTPRTHMCRRCYPD